MSFSRGFSFIELLITLVIMSVMAMLAVPAVQIEVQRKQETELRHALYDIRTAIDNYKIAYDNNRIRNEIGASGYPPNLQILVDGVIDERSPDKNKIYFLRRLPQDPLIESKKVQMVTGELEAMHHLQMILKKAMMFMISILTQQE